jgi:hypothetical protein
MSYTFEEVTMMRDIDLGDNLVGKYVGILEIHELYDDGRFIIKHAPNVITFEARRILTYLLAGEDSVNRFVNTLKVGTSNTAPARTDDNLGSVKDSVPVVYTFPDIDRVRFEGILTNASPANNEALVEAGLFNNSSQLFARQVYPVVTKTSALQLKYIWTIIFT